MHSNTLFTRLFFSLLLAFISMSGVGQSIDQIEIIPEDPITTEDVVSVIATAWHPTQGCPIVNTEFVYSQDTITVIVEHELGVATAICNSVDTTSFPSSFAPGTYKVEYVMVSGGFGDFAVTDTAYTEFTVEGVNSINDRDSEAVVSIYPNPSTGNLSIETNWRGQIDVCNLLGKELKAFRIDRSPFIFSTADFSSGVYFLAPLDGRAIKGEKFVVR